MANPIAYSLSLEMLIQSNASEVLQSVSNEITTIDDKLKAMTSNLSGSLDDISTKFAKTVSSFKSPMQSFQQGVNGLQAAINTANISQPVNAMTQSVVQLQNATQSVNNSTSNMGKNINAAATGFTIPLDKMQELRDTLEQIGNINALQYETEYVDKAITAYNRLTNDILPEVMRMKEEMGRRGVELTYQESNAINDAFKVKKQLLQKQKQLETEFARLRKRWKDTTGNDFKFEKKSRLQLLTMGREQRSLFSELNRVALVRAKINSATAKDAGSKATLEAQAQELAGNDKLIGKTNALSAAVHAVSATMKEMGALAAKGLSGLGFSNVAKATTAAGLYELTVNSLIDREEKFHEVSFRAVGSAKQLSDEITSLAKAGKTNLLPEELIDASIQLRKVGASAEEVRGLREEVGYLGRTTGASTAAAAKFAKQMKVVTGSESLASNQLRIMERYAKENALTGEDLNQVLAESAVTSQMLNGDSAQKYTSSLLAAASAAKKLGMDTNSAVNAVSQLKEPLNAVAVLGAEAMDMSPDQITDAMAKAASSSLNYINNIQDVGERNRAMYAEAARYGTSYGDLMSRLRLLSEIGIEKQKASEKGLNDVIANRNDEMKQGAKDAETTARQRAMTDANVAAKLQEQFSWLKDAVEKITNYISNSDVSKSVMAWGTSFVSAGSGVLDFTAKIASLYSTFKLLSLARSAATTAATAETAVASAGIVRTVAGGALRVVGLGIQAVGAIGGFCASAASSLAGMAGSAFSFITSGISVILPALGSAASSIAGFVASAAGPLLALGAAAIAGWKIGQTLDNWIGISQGVANSTKRLIEGKAAWYDYLNPIGLVNAALVKQSILETELAKKEAIRKGIAVENNNSEVQMLQKRLAEVDKAANRATGDERNKLSREADVLNTKIRELQDAESKREQEAVANGQKLANMSQERYDYLRKDYENKKIKELTAPASDAAKVVNAQEQKPAITTAPAVEMAGKVTAPDLTTILNDNNKKQQEMVDEIQRVMTTALNEKVIKVPESQVEEQEKAKIEPVFAVKMSDETARPKASEEELEELRKQNTIISSMLSKLDKSAVGEITNLLKEFLPKMAERETGLASAANQWVN